MSNRKTVRRTALMLAAGLMLCGCSRINEPPSPTAVPHEQTAEITLAPTPTPVSSLAEHRTIDGVVHLENEVLRAAANGSPLLHIRADGTLSAAGLMLDLAKGTADPSLTAMQQAALRTDSGGTAVLTASTLASDMDNIPLLAADGGTLKLTDTMAVHTGTGAATLAAANGGKIEAIRSECIAGGAGSAALLARDGGSIDCTAGTRVTAAEDGTSLAMCLLGDGSVSVADGELFGDVFLTGSGNTLQCSNTQFVGNLRFENAEDEIDLHLQSGSRFVGTTDGDGAIGIRIALDATSTWQLTGDAYVAVLSDADTTLSNIHSGGYSLYYNAESEENLWLSGKTLSLNGGGYLIPLI